MVMTILECSKVNRGCVWPYVLNPECFTTYASCTRDGIELTESRWPCGTRPKIRFAHFSEALLVRIIAVSLRAPGVGLTLGSQSFGGSFGKYGTNTRI